MNSNPTVVLLIEDNPGDARLIQEMLVEVEGTSFDVVCADRLSAGLERLDKGGIDAVLLDLSLPDSQGIETFTRMHEHAQDVPILVLTGLDDEGFALETVKKGAQDYLVKGKVNSDALVRVIRYALERHRLLSEVQKLQEQLLETERVRVVAETAGAAGHEINQPLTVINGKTEHMLMKMGPDDPYRRHIELIHEAGLRIEEIVVKMKTARRYSTTAYPTGGDIVDFDAAAQEGTQDDR